MFKEVVGHRAAVQALQTALQTGMRCFLFIGPSGIGKTTLARIMAKKLECEIQPIDGATYTSIENMRGVQETAQYIPFGAKGRAIIVDECHRLSPQAWDSLLTATEEPPPGVYWFFCTTNADKVPTTIKTRSLRLTLKPLSRDELTEVVDRVCKAEGINIEPSIRQLIVAEADGSARQALVYLDACRNAKSRAEVAELLQSAQDSEPVLQLCRLLTNGRGVVRWQDATRIYAALDGENPEGVRIRVVNYIAKTLQNARSDNDARRLLGKLEAFAYPYGQADGAAQLLRSIGACMFGQ